MITSSPARHGRPAATMPIPSLVECVRATDAGSHERTDAMASLALTKERVYALRAGGDANPWWVISRNSSSSASQANTPASVPMCLY